MKKLVIFLACLLLSTGSTFAGVKLFFSPAYDAEWEDIKHLFPQIALVNDVFYNLNNEEGTAIATSTIGTLPVSDMGYQVYGLYEGSVIIPDDITVGGKSYAVTVIDKMEGDITSVKIGKKVKEIYQGFKGNKNLRSVELPESLEKLIGSAFENTGVTSLFIPRNCYGADKSSTMNWVLTGNQLEDIRVHADNPYFKDTDGVLYTKDGSVMLTYPFSRKSERFEILPGTVRFYDRYALYRISQIKSLSMPQGFSQLTGEYCLPIMLPPTLDSLYCSSEYAINGQLSLTPPENYSNDVEQGKRKKMVMVVPDEYLGSYHSMLDNIFDVVRLSDFSAPYCTLPSIRYEEGRITFDCETKGATFTTSVTCLDQGKHQGNAINLKATCLIEVIAKATGYKDSEIETATICWLNNSHELGFNPDSEVEPHARPLLIQAKDGVLSLAGLEEGETIQVFSIDGRQLSSAKAFGSTLTIPVTSPSGQTLIVKIADKAVKVMMR